MVGIGTGAGFDFARDIEAVDVTAIDQSSFPIPQLRLLRASEDSIPLPYSQLTTSRQRGIEMANANTEPRTETMELGGHVVTRGCRYLPDSKKWAPYVSIRASWNPSAEMQIDVKPEEFQDTANDAMELARVLSEAWVKQNKPPIPT